MKDQILLTGLLLALISAFSEGYIVMQLPGDIPVGQLFRVRRQAPTINVHGIPKTGFSCNGKKAGEYYADPETLCQVYHICLPGASGKMSPMSFACPNGTIFSQASRVCSPYDRVYCPLATRFYENLHGDLHNRRTDYVDNSYLNEDYPSSYPRYAPKLEDDDPEPSEQPYVPAERPRAPSRGASRTTAAPAPTAAPPPPPPPAPAFRPRLPAPAYVNPIRTSRPAPTPPPPPPAVPAAPVPPPPPRSIPSRFPSLPSRTIPAPVAPPENSPVTALPPAGAVPAAPLPSRPRLPATLPRFRSPVPPPPPPPAAPAPIITTTTTHAPTTTTTSSSTASPEEYEYDYYEYDQPQDAGNTPTRNKRSARARKTNKYLPPEVDTGRMPVVTSFSCQDKLAGGVYADIETNCEMFHVCIPIAKGKLLDYRLYCANGTAFNQETGACEEEESFECSRAEKHYLLDKIGSHFAGKKPAGAKRRKQTSAGLVTRRKRHTPEPPSFGYETLPVTGFTCRGKVSGGYYADVETDCQLFHICASSNDRSLIDMKFLCVNGTVFNQKTLVCEPHGQVICSQSPSLYETGFVYILEKEKKQAREDERQQKDADIDLKKVKKVVKT